MIGGRNDKGFTLFEVMIFLAITGGLFIIAAVAINGKQAQAEFATGVRDFNSQIQAVIGGVSNGYFPDKASYNCSFTGGVHGAALDLTATGTSGAQGTHPDCAFMGKVLYFDTSAPAAANQYSAFTIAGISSDDHQQAPVNYDFAHLVAVHSASGSTADLTENSTLENGILVEKIITNEGGVIKHPAAFGIFVSLDECASSPVTTGTLGVCMVSIPASLAGETEAQTVTKVNAISPGNSAFVNPSVAICLQHGVGGKKAVIIIGKQNRQVYSEVHIGDVDAAVWNSVTVPGGETC